MVEMTKHYTARAVHWDRGWEVHIDDVGVTQSRTLSGAAPMACAYLASMLGGDSADYDVAVEPDLDGLEDVVSAVRVASREAAERQQAAGAKSREVARELRRRGLSVSDIAELMGLSRGRVSQLTS